ncbi:MAG: hypothetical protein ACPG7F_04365 [Aggregatilineales bacterium]
MSIRRATLDDTGAISALCRNAIPRWQRMAAGQVEDVAYEDLSLYERWLHGGAWMSIETASIWLSHLLSGAGVPYVLLEDDMIVGYLEAFTGKEPAPYHNHLHIGNIRTNNNADHAQALIQHIQQMHSQNITVACSAYEPDMQDFLGALDFEQIEMVLQVDMPAQTGQSFYQANEHHDTVYNQIKGWLMPIGRTESARTHWEGIWANLWRAIPEITARKMQRLHIVAAGQEAYVAFHQQLYNPRNADVYCWTPKPLSKSLISAIRDRAHREGYRNLAMVVSESALSLLKVSADTAPYKQNILLYKP